MFKYYFIFLPIFFLSCQNNSKELDLINAEIKTVRTHYVKDGRTALFKLNAETNKENKIVIKGETTFPKAKKELLEKLNTVQKTIIDSIQILPADHLNGYIYGVVSLSVCNIRSKPKHSAELATQAVMGTPLRVLKKEGDFYLIQTPDNYLGWVDDGGLALMDKAAYNNWMASKKAVCLNDYVFAYRENDENAIKVTDLLAGNIIRIAGYQGDFTKIQMPDGRIGFVKNEYLMPYDKWLDSQKATSENILATAKEMIGRPYLWGGTSGKGMDCSGFTKTVFYLNGIQLERDASLQVHTGEVVETDTTLKNLQAGDLLFFGKYRDDGSERITHVAIYMGEGKIIHASDRVKIESLKRGDANFVEDRLKSFMQARRMIGSEGKNGIFALNDLPYY